jgi:hypothetical protein
LSPVSLIGLLVYTVALLFGWLALGARIGDRLAGALRLRGLSPIVAAALGAFLITLVVHGIGLFPLVGGLLSGLVQVVLASIGLGAVTLTRFGTQPYLASPPAPASPPPPGEPPAVPPLDLPPAPPAPPPTPTQAG